jgi:FtsP/CotA-like multicopper oxidase with cupredoxin domain
MPAETPAPHPQGDPTMTAPSTAASSHDHAGMPGMGGEAGGDARMVSPVTRPQIVAVTLATVLALTAALLFSAMRVNLRLSAREVGGAVMPPGMIMTYDTPGKAMTDMAAVNPRDVTYTAPTEARGDQSLAPRLENGVKVYHLDLSVIKWNILPDVQVMAYAFNRQVPGPRLRITEGDHVRIVVTNRLPEATTVHWHGLIVPNDMDGPADIAQKPIPPGGNYTYEFTAKQHGTYFYHSHREPDRQQTLGMYGAIIIDPKDPTVIPPHDSEYVVQLQEWLHREGYTYPSMIMEGGLPNYFTINGKAYPATDTIRMKVGQKLLLRFIGSSNSFIHPMHVHGGPVRVVATDGNPLQASAQYEKDTINIAPGERYDVIWPARAPGKWLLHCHIPHHTTNNNVEEHGGGGLTLVIEVQP